MLIFKQLSYRLGLQVTSQLNMGLVYRSQRLLHNLASNTFDKVSSSKEVSPIVIMHGLFGTKQNWSSISKALNANSSPTRKVREK